MNTLLPSLRKPCSIGSVLRDRIAFLRPWTSSTCSFYLPRSSATAHYDFRVRPSIESTIYCSKQPFHRRIWMRTSKSNQRYIQPLENGSLRPLEAKRVFHRRLSKCTDLFVLVLVRNVNQGRSRQFTGGGAASPIWSQTLQPKHGQLNLAYFTDARARSHLKPSRTVDKPCNDGPKTLALS
jgi:hypothetical protein